MQTPLITGKLTGRLGPYGKPLTRGGTVLTGRASPLREAPYGEGRSLREGPVLTGSPLTGALTGRPPYGKAPYELQESLRERLREGHLTGRGAPYGEGPLGRVPYEDGSLHKKGRRTGLREG